MARPIRMHHTTVSAAADRDEEEDDDAAIAAAAAAIGAADPADADEDSAGADEWLIDRSGAADASPALDGDGDPELDGRRLAGDPTPLRLTNLPSLTGAILASGTTGGITYAFGLYSNALKHTLHLSQSELDTISSAFFCAGLLSWAPGMAADTYGPRRSLAAGGITMAVSLLGFWAVARVYVPVPPKFIVPVLSLLGVASFMSSALVTGSVFKLIVASTGPGTKGSAVGAAKGYVGLGAGAYACLFEALRGNAAAPPSSGMGESAGDPSDLNFLPMAAALAVLVGTVPALCLIPPNAGLVDPNPRRRLSGPEDAASPHHFRAVYAGLLGLGAVVVGTSVGELFDDDDGGSADSKSRKGAEGAHLGRAALILAMWLMPILSLLCLPRKGKASEEVPLESLLEETRIHRGVPGLPTTRTRPRLGRRRKAGARYSALPVGTTSAEAGGGEDEEIDSVIEETQLEDAGVAPREADDEEGGSATDSAGSEIATAVLAKDAGGDREHLISNGADGAPPSPRSRPDPRRVHLHPTEVDSAPRPIGELPLTSMLQTSPAWLLLWTCTILCGGGTVMTNNVGQMVEALKFDSKTAPASLALFSAAQSLTRVCTGSLSESALAWKRKVPRPAFLVVASLFGFVSHLLLCVATTEIVFVAGVALTGAAFGMIWPLMVLIVGEAFGTRNVGANYMFYDGVTSALGTLLLSKFVAQEVYESHIHRDHDFPGEDVGGGAEDDGLTCYGEGCFKMSHAVVAGLSLSCVLSSAALMYKTREVYARR